MALGHHPLAHLGVFLRMQIAGRVARGNPERAQQSERDVHEVLADTAGEGERFDGGRAHGRRPALVRQVRARPVGHGLDRRRRFEPGSDLARDRRELRVRRHVRRRSQELVELVVTTGAGEHFPAHRRRDSRAQARLDERSSVNHEPLVRLVDVEGGDLRSPVVDISQHDDTLPRPRPE